MERAIATKKLLKLLGKKFGYQINKEALSPDEREALRPELQRAREMRDKLNNLREARYKELLADPEYRALCDQSQKARKYAEELGWKVGQKKITVGTSNSMFFHVEAEGDSWEEVISKIEAKRQAA